MATLARLCGDADLESPSLNSHIDGDEFFFGIFFARDIGMVAMRKPAKCCFQFRRTGIFAYAQDEMVSIHHNGSRLLLARIKYVTREEMLNDIQPYSSSNSS